MVTKGKQWKREDLLLSDIREHGDFQWRLDGLSVPHLNGIVRTLEAGDDAREPVRVAKVGQVLYLVDGFHRLEAYRRAGRRTIPAEIAKMSKGEALEAAKGSNALNGKPYSLADKARLWDEFVAAGGHLEPDGSTKPLRDIVDELPGRFYSHETIRKRLKVLGLDLNKDDTHGGAYKPRGTGSEQDDLDELALEADASLRRFGSLISDIEPHERERLLRAAQGIFDAASRGDRPDIAAIWEDTAPF
jgi:hypothetical protein